MKIVGIIIGWVCLVVSSTGLANVKLAPTTPSLQREIAKRFYIGNNLQKGLDDKKVEAFRNKIRQMRKEYQDDELASFVEETGEPLKKLPPRTKAKVAAKVNESDEGIALNWAEKITDGFLSGKNLSLNQQLDQCAQLLEIEYALRFTGLERTIPFAVEAISEMARVHHVFKYSSASEEAEDLYDPSLGRYLTVSEIEAKTKAGQDISKFDPHPRSTFWRRPKNLSKVSPKNALLVGKGIDPIFSNTPVVYPKSGDGVELSTINTLGTSPKFYVSWKNDKGKEYRYQLKFMFETYADPVANALSKTLGFPADTSKRFENVKVYLNDYNYQALRNAWQDQYGEGGQWRGGGILEEILNKDPKTGKYIQYDKKGPYIVAKYGVMEPWQQTHARLNGWAYGKLGHDNLRAVRGLKLFNVWISNADMKEDDNNALVLAPNGKEGDYNFFHIQSDIGLSLGGMVAEKLDGFPDEAAFVNVSSVSPSVIFNYWSASPNSLVGKVTWSDARWTVRLISQLQKWQIREAVQLGGFPKWAEDIYVEKLISRRNSLVKAFGLAKEIPLMEAQPEQQMAKHEDKLEGSKFDGQLKELVTPTLRKVKEMLQGAVQGAFAVRGTAVDIDGLLGSDTGLVFRPTIQLTREVIMNPTARGTQDDYQINDEKYLVTDTVEIGLRLGVEVGAELTGSYKEKYVLSYPSFERKDGIWAGDVILNIFLPWDMAKEKLPKNFVLQRDELFDARVGFEAKATDWGAGMRPYTGVAWLNGHIIARKDGIGRFFDYSTLQHETGVNAFWKLLILEPNFLIFKHISDGKMEGAIYEADVSQRSAQVGAAVSKAIQEGDFRDLTNVAHKKDIQSNYDGYDLEFDIFGLFGATEDARYDQRKDREQFRRRSMSFHNLLLDNKETHDVRSYSCRKYDESFPVIEVNYLITDKDTRSEELRWFDSNGGEFSQSYLGFVNGLAGEEDFYNFTPDYHNNTPYWNEVWFNTHLIFYEKATEKLLNLPLETFWQEVYAEMGVKSQKQIEEFRSLASPSEYSRLHDGHTDPFKACQDAECYKRVLISQRAELFANRLRRAQTTNDSETRTENLTLALHDAVPELGVTFEPTLMRVIKRIVGEDHYFMKTTATTERGNEFRFPFKAPRSQGVMRPEKQCYFNLAPRDGIELYHMFDNID